MKEINIEYILNFLIRRKESLYKNISINKHSEDWVNEYQDYILGKIVMCDAIIFEIKRLMK
jgi:hypothetical protein